MVGKSLNEIVQLKQLKIAADLGDAGARKEFYNLRNILKEQNVPVNIELEQTVYPYDNLKYLGRLHTVMETEVEDTISILEQHGLKAEVHINYECIPDSVDIEIYVKV